MDFDAELRRPSPDRILRLSLPEPLRERRPGIGLVLLLREEPDGAALVVVADPLARRVCGHAATDDQVLESAHRGRSYKSASVIRNAR
jgi:hypothetical protein